ncbi:hypothetical protein O1611_g1015 [Lasiodiplodia mahajangana]|uniref:Uncharacterized protein n=1 Tax=Lasiodiplodia mahajangana TaxID=1108764 RepID=A0ACC2JZ73_9PEZI|nr:hypothetical protein O1611_g1015 [Lasiodiplodia mahajangana]
MEDVAFALGSIKAIVWGEDAMGFVGVGTIRNNLILVIQDSDLNAAIKSLHAAGFRDAPWSYGSIVNPELYEDEKLRRLHRWIAIEYRYIDVNSIRLEYPADSKEEGRVILVRSSYAHLSLQSIPKSRFTLHKGMYFPDCELLLESFAKTAVREPEPSKWSSTLEFWSVTYLYGQLMLGDDVLDSSTDDSAKAWFNGMIRRYSGGFDRSITKRRGRRDLATQPQC